MIGLVMAGGKGTRMKSNEEKLLLQYKQPLVLHVIDALKNSNCFEKIIAATSPNSPQTKKILVGNNITIIETSGEGFVIDLNNILKQLDDLVLVASGDLPLLDGDIIKHIIANVNHDKTWTSIVTTKSFQNSLNLEPECVTTINDEDYAHTGISIVNASKISNLDTIEEDYLIIDDKRVCFNINTKNEYDLLSSI